MNIPGLAREWETLHLVQLQAGRDLELERERRISVGQDSDEYEQGCLSVLMRISMTPPAKCVTACFCCLLSSDYHFTSNYSLSFILFHLDDHPSI